MQQVEKKQPLVSIVMPIYNTEQFLDMSIGSILAQDYKNWELFLIDDGSSDGSLAACQRFSSQDARIKTIHQENQGVSVARNTGLREITGTFLGFLDSDDAMAPGALSELVRQITEHEADVVFFNILSVTSTGAKPRIEVLDTGVVSSEGLLRQMIGYHDAEGKFHGYFFNCANKFYRISSLQHNEQGVLPFDLGIPVLEDGLWLMKHIHSFYRGVLDSRTWLHQTVHSGSVMNDEDKWLSRTQVYLSSFSKITALVEHHGNDTLTDLAKGSLFRAIQSNVRKAFDTKQVEAVPLLLDAVSQPYLNEFTASELRSAYILKNSASFKLGRKITVLQKESKLFRTLYAMMEKIYNLLKKG